MEEEKSDFYYSIITFHLQLLYRIEINIDAIIYIQYNLEKL